MEEPIQEEQLETEEQTQQTEEESEGATIADLIRTGAPTNRIPTGNEEEASKEEEGEPSKPAEEAQESKEATPSEESESEEEPEARWTDLKGAEKSFQHLEKKMHESTQKAAALERELAELKSKQPTAKEPQESEVDPVEQIALNTMEEINKLDADDPDYNKNVLKLMAKQNQLIATEVAKQTDNTKRQQHERIQSIEKRLQDEGLSEFAEEFWNLGAAVPAEITKFDDQVDWGIKQVQALVAKVTKLAEEKAVKHVPKEEEFSLPSSRKQPLPKKSHEEEEQAASERTLRDDIHTVRKRRTVTI